MKYSLIELLFVLALIGVITGASVPMVSNIVGTFKLGGDARALANSVSLTRMQAASNFSRTRLYIDLATKAYHTEIKTGAAAWATRGNLTYLSSPNESYNFGVVTTPPTNTQAVIGQASQCLNDATPAVAIGNTACIVFNSRGIPIDAAGAPTGAGAFYLTDGITVYGVTVSATSIIRTWKTTATATPTWVRQ